MLDGWMSSGSGGGAAGLITTLSGLANSFGRGSVGMVHIESIVKGFADLSGNIRRLSLDKRKLKKVNEYATELSETMSAITGMPDGIGDKVQTVTQGMADLTAVLNAAASDPGLAIAMEVGKGLSENGTVTVQHENVNITINVN